ncbi:MAG TPA: histidine kinase [Anaerolineaceae bacterium]|nr:histidine kinase [Anaerolineaceae bacterium]
MIGENLIMPEKQKRADKKPTLLSGGNPQIAKGEGEAPVQAYIEAMPGWKGDVGRFLDALIVQNVPDVKKAVKWNSPSYGVGGQGWFLSFHCLTKYVKVAFFSGSLLQPIPPGESKSKEVCYLNIYESDQLDEDLLANWIRQAAALPGWVP